MKSFCAPLKAAFLFVFALAFVFFSCSNINAGEAYFQQRESAPLSQVDLPKDSGADSGGVLAEPCVSNARTVTICIGGAVAGGQSSTQSKTILPIDAMAIGDLTFVLRAVPNEGDIFHHVLSGALQYSIVLNSVVYNFYSLRIQERRHCGRFDNARQWTKSWRSDIERKRH